jgi:hypothetical protein
MAAIIESVLQTGVIAYAIIRNNAGLVWNGSSFEAYNSANWATYAVSLTEQASSSYFKASFPSAISAGIYSFVIHQGSPPAIGDYAVDRGTIDWDGSSQNYIGLIIDKLPTSDISGFNHITDNVNLNSNQSGVTVGTVNALGSSASDAVKTQIDTSLGSDSITELLTTPSGSPTMKQALMFLFMALRNKRTSEATSVKVYNSAGTVIATAVQSDNGAIYTKENFS